MFDLTSHAHQVELFKANADLQWTYVIPNFEFVKEGERTGKYTIATDVFSTNSEGNSVISYADYAMAIADIISTQQHIKETISVRY